MASRPGLAGRVADGRPTSWTQVDCWHRHTSSMPILVNMVLNVALPTISRDPHATSTGRPWLGAASVMMERGTSLLVTPMASAVLKSVKNAKSSVAAAVNGALRRTGFARGVALHGSVVYRSDRDRFAPTPAVRAMREGADPVVPLRPPLDVAGDGMSCAGCVVETASAWPDVLRPPIGAQPAKIVTRIGQARGEAVVAGTDRAFVLASAVIVLFAAPSPSS